MRTHILVVSFVLLATTASAGEETDPYWQKLIRLYSDFELPVPPKDAQLVKFESGRSSENSKDYQLGFLLKRGAKNESSVFLVGTEEFNDRVVNQVPVKAVDVDCSQIKSEWRNGSFSTEPGVATAIQLRMRGESDLADRLLIAAKGKHPLQFRRFVKIDRSRIETILAHVAMRHWENELAKPGTDRAAIAKRMEKLLQVERSLEVFQPMLDSLKLALKPSNAQPGSIEAQIDALIEMSGYQGGFPGLQNGYDQPEYLALVRRGFDAVPALIEHVDDERLTRAVQGGFNNFQPYVKRVGHVVGDLLRGIAGDEIGQDWLRRQQGYYLDKKEVKKWWEKIQAENEEAHLVVQIFANGKSVEKDILKIIESKYPGRLSDLYLTLLDKHSGIQSFEFAKAIGRSKLENSLKIRLFLHATDNKDINHRRAALWELKELDRAAFKRIMIENLKAIPVTPEGSYWNCAEAGFPQLVMQTDDPEVWKVFSETAKRVDVGFRMQLMNPMNYTFVGENQCSERIAFLKQFLTDKNERTIDPEDKKFEGPCAGFHFPVLSVRDFAALQISSILKLEVRPEKDWTAAQWNEFREKVKEALANEK